MQEMCCNDHEVIEVCPCPRLGEQAPDFVTDTSQEESDFPNSIKGTG